MPYKEKEITKMFYTIGEVADMFKVNPSHIRFWSNQFEELKPATNKKGNRLFTPQDLENLKLIYHLVKEKGFTLKGAKIEMKAMRKKMRLESKPENAKPEAAAAIQTEELPFREKTPDTRAEHAIEYMDRITLVNNLRKLKAELLKLQEEVDRIAG